MNALLLNETVENDGQYSDWYKRAVPAYDSNGQENFRDENGDLVEGIYLDMPNDVYHSLPALSSSALKKFIESPAHYFREYLSNVSRKRTLGMQRTFDAGTHAHTLILEPEGYYKQFFRDVLPVDYPDSLTTAAQIEEELVKRNLKKSGTKAEKTARLLEADPSVLVFDAIAEKYYAKIGVKSEAMWEGNPVTTYGGKIPVDGQVWDDAHRAANTTRNHSEADNYFQFGAPEVAMIAKCPITGLMLKVKFDWLRHDDDAIDMKTTQSTKPEDFKRQIFNLHYDVQQEFYKYAALLQDITIRSFVFVATEYVNADICQPFELPQKYINLASNKVQKSLKEIKKCMETGNWYGWSKEDCTMVLQ